MQAIDLFKKKKKLFKYLSASCLLLCCQLIEFHQKILIMSFGIVPSTK